MQKELKNIRVLVEEKSLEFSPYRRLNERIELLTLTLRAPTQNRKGELLSPPSPGPILIEAISILPLSLGELIHQCT